MWCVRLLLAVLLPFASAQNVSTVSPSNDNNDNVNDIQAVNCRYLLLAPFSTEKGDTADANFTELGAHYAASAQLAIDYLNEEYEGCTITQDGGDGNRTGVSPSSVSSTRKLVEFGDLLTRDTQQEDTTGFQELVQAVEGYGTNENDDSTSSSSICGVVGPFDGKGQEKTITYTEVHELPTMTLTGMDIDDLAGKDSKTAIGNMMDLKDYCKHLAFYLKHYMDMTHLAVIANGSKKGRLLEDKIPEAMAKQGIETRVLRFEEDKHEDWEKTRQDLEQIQLTGIHNVLILADYRKPEALLWMAQHLETLDMLQGDYQYFLFEDNVRPREINYLFGKELQDKDHPIAKLLHGAAWFNTMDPFELVVHADAETNSQLPAMDPFLPRFQEFDATRIDYPKTGIPLGQDHFQTAIPFRLSSYVYDSILAMGMGKCYAIKEKLQKDAKDDDKMEEDNRRFLQDNNNSPPPRPEDDEDSKDGPPPRPDGEEGDSKPPPKKDEPKPPKNDVVRNIVQLEPFLGASGTVAFDYNKDERFRAVDTMQMAMFNFRVVENQDSGVMTVETPIAAHLDTSTQQWITLQSFLFGSTSSDTLPNPQFVVSEENFLSNWVFGLGLFLFVFGAVFALASFAAVTYYQKDGAIRMAQPFFLKLICLGSFIEVCTILPLSLDESRGLDDGQLDAACMSVPLLVFIGHAIIYSAIFCKLWRVDQVMSAQRRTRIELQVLWPLGLVLFVIVTILIVWTAVSPWRWEHDFVSLSPPETYGKCHSDNFAAFFAPLSAILMACTLLTGFFVWRTKDISQDLSDTSTVFYLIVTQLQAWFVGLPILAVIGDSSVNSVYFGRILLIWVFAMAPLLIVLGSIMVSGLEPTSQPASLAFSHTVGGTGGGPHGSVALSNGSTPFRASVAAPAIQPHVERASFTSSTGGRRVSDFFDSTSEFAIEGDDSEKQGGLTLEHISEHPGLEEAAVMASERRIEEEATKASSHDQVDGKERALENVEEDRDYNQEELDNDSDEFCSG
ncbi:expressed unknown protein [Seminavis robusta]|uniref:G-protein coupled receptors family 3 profile domain-containing protein n=1 Tax=Seminavis robusta TaxID=568900 RepID=A0A9N8DJ79_9STRA|nr:expressed unknown protein [Seminavis robusta]